MLNAYLADVQTRVEEALPQLKRSYYRLVLVCGKPGSGKTRILHTLQQRTGYPLHNANLEISEHLLEHTVAERSSLVPDTLRKIVNGAGTEVILLDNLELLFDASLSLNPLQILQSNSRNTTIVASWNGTCINGVLTYAEPGHPEHRSYHLSPQDAVIFGLE